MSEETVPVTEGERYIYIVGKIGRLTDAIEGLTKEMQQQEIKRIEPLEVRMTVIETWKNEFSGAYKFILLLVSLGTIISLILSLKK